MFNKQLIVHVIKGSSAKPGILCADCCARADYTATPTGDSVGVVYPTGARARQILAAEVGVTVLPPHHRPLKPNHIALLAYAGVVDGDTTYDAAEKLFTFHRMPWFHPEINYDSRDKIQDLLGPYTPPIP
jgi:hypothetical protein